MGPGVRDAGVGKPQCENTLYIHPEAMPIPMQSDSNLPDELAKNWPNSSLRSCICYRLLFMISTTPLKRSTGQF